MLLINFANRVVHDLDHLTESCSTDDIPETHRIQVEKDSARLISSTIYHNDHLAFDSSDRLRGVFFDMCQHCMSK